MQNACSKPIYAETIRSVEKMTEIVYFATVYLTIPAVMMPSCLITVYNYFILDLKEESFFLPLPQAFVLQLFFHLFDENTEEFECNDLFFLVFHSTGKRFLAIRWSSSMNLYTNFVRVYFYHRFCAFWLAHVGS